MLGGRGGRRRFLAPRDPVDGGSNPRRSQRRSRVNGWDERVTRFYFRRRPRIGPEDLEEWAGDILDLAQQEMERHPYADTWQAVIHVGMNFRRTRPGRKEVYDYGNYPRRSIEEVVEGTFDRPELGLRAQIGRILSIGDVGSPGASLDWRSGRIPWFLIDMVIVASYAPRR